ncbi:MAG: exo-alpha-sialidase [Clostridia bacterium]|nr:exo-alpha-sialidase [Clostridia bacterium]
MSVKRFTISRDESVYEAWPDVVLTEGGKLICVFAECKQHLERDGARIMITESRDRGRTWSKKRPLTEKGSKNNFFNCPRISKLRDGSLAIICDRLDGWDNGRTALTYVWHGDKEGLNWSEPRIFNFNGIVPDKLLQLESGRLIISNHCKNANNGKSEQHLWYSDDGENWSQRITVAADERYNLCEVSILECENGTLIGFLRENSKLGYDILKVVSYDNGETWSPVYNTGIDSGHRPVAGFLADGTVMITYRYIPQTTNNVFAAFLPKEALLATERGKQRIRIMPLDYDRNPSPDLGYTGWVQFDDGEIYVVNYIKDDSDKAFIRGYSFYPNDVVLPETENTVKNVF